MSPGYVKPEPETFVPVGPTKQVEKWAELKTVDMATFNDGPEARKALANTLKEAMTTQGFFVLKNHGITQDEITRMTNIGWTALNKTSDEEKQRLKAPMFEEGSYRGFKLRGHYLGAGGSKDKIEQFNWFRSCEAQEFPSPVVPFLDEIKTFSKKMYVDVLYDVLRLFAIALELDQEFFVEKLKFGKNDQSWLRIMAYYDEFTKEEEKARGGVWFQGHTDFNLLSLLCSQPMASLQIQDYDDEGNWKFIPYCPGAIIINAGSYMEWFTGGFFKAAIHRVVGPPDDQRNHTRASLFAFVIPNDEVTIETISTSPVLNAYKDLQKCQPVNSEQFARARIAVVGQSQQHKDGMKEGAKDFQIVNGIKLPMFG